MDLVRQLRNLFKAPNVVSHSRFHRRGYAQGLVDAAEIVMHVVERHGMLVVFDFLGESIC